MSRSSSDAAASTAETTRSDRERLRLTFAADADRYDRMRPGYPSQLFDDLAELACIGPGCRVLEIGVGTGQATLPVAARGCELIGVELSPSLAMVAQRKLTSFPDVDIVVSSLEDWPLPPDPFDTVLSATAFHWIDPAVRVIKTADALRPDGALATIGTHHVAGGTAEFFAEVQACYERWDPATPVGLRLAPAHEIRSDSEELDQSGRFGPAVFRRYEWESSYSTDEYRELLLTYSGHLDLDQTRREGLLECITGVIDTSYGGRIAKRYLTELRVAHTSR